MLIVIHILVYTRTCGTKVIEIQPPTLRARLPMHFVVLLHSQIQESIPTKIERIQYLIHVYPPVSSHFPRGFLDLKLAPPLWQSEVADHKNWRWSVHLLPIRRRGRLQHT